MKLTPSDPDLATLNGRITRGDLDLQPDFQRQEVWPKLKKQRLIDTILRDWHIPPIHVVELADGRHEVLDGQQRLVAIRDFMRGGLRVYGHFDPKTAKIQALHDLRYDDLPDEYRRRFDRYAVRVITLTNYDPQEPGELFFRLNQQTVLTAPEQRNAFFGPARDQVKKIVSEAVASGLRPETIGFSNSRMAYDDIVARFCEALELGTLKKKITASAITDRYRSQEPFSQVTVTRARDVIGTFLELVGNREEPSRFNKATSHTWFCFIAAAKRECPAAFSSASMGRFLDSIESSRHVARTTDGVPSDLSTWLRIESQTAAYALRIYNDRTSARVADVSSVLVRDFVTWLFVDNVRFEIPPDLVSAERRRLIVKAQTLLQSTVDDRDPGETLGAFLERSDWGRQL